MSTPEVTEALLEAQYTRAIAKAIGDVYGKYTFQFFKPSAQDEAFLGFDQGWVRVGRTRAHAMFADIRMAIEGRGPAKWLWAYFLQFKRVSRMSRRSAETPLDIVAPYYRAEISLRPNPRSRKSQHETLLELSAVPRSEVYYACPMMFSRDDVYRDVDLETLRLVDVGTAPRDYLANERHFLAFRAPADVTPRWCSVPTPTETIGPEQWLHSRAFDDRFGAASRGVLRRLLALRDDYPREPPSIVHQSVLPPKGGEPEFEHPEPEDDWSPAGVPMSLVLVVATER